MLSTEQLEQIRQFAQEVAAREGCLLYDLEFFDGPARSLRVYIDREGKDGSKGGVSIEDCANVSRGLNLRLDVEDAIPGGAYDLEVSSPGLDRKLTQLWHFERAVGKQIRLQFRKEDGSTQSYEGRLLKVVGKVLSFENSKGDWEVEFASVLKARIQPVDVLQKKDAPGKKKR